MEKTIFGVTLLLLGLVLGSFVNAAVWRIKNKRNLSTDRSECIHCHHKLSPLDLVPVCSWLYLKGKCRYCKKPISPQYPIVELAVAAFFVASLAFWPNGFDSPSHLLQFALWLLVGVGLAILVVYDLKWLILPDKVVFPLVALGAAMSIIWALESPSIGQYLINLAGSLFVLSGFYLVLYIYSSGRWIGFGDVKLGVVLALMLSNWQLSLVALFLANLIGTLVFIPALLTKKVKRTSHIPFGPFLVIGFILAGLFGQVVIDWYMAVAYSGIVVPQYTN